MYLLCCDNKITLCCLSSIRVCLILTSMGAIFEILVDVTDRKTRKHLPWTLDASKAKRDYVHHQLIRELETVMETGIPARY